MPMPCDLTKTLAAVLLMAGASLVTAGPAAAQGDSLRMTASLSAVVGTPVASFGDRVDGAGGLEAMLRVGRDASPMTWRVGLGVLFYGWDTETVCVSTTIGCRLRMGVTTTNEIWSLETGPEFRRAVGRAEWRGALVAGGSFMVTNTGVTGDYQPLPILGQSEVEDGGFVWGGGLGLSLPLGDQRRVRFDAEASYRQHGRRRYLVEGGITELIGGGVVRDVQRSEVALLQWRVGLSFALPESTRR